MNATKEPTAAAAAVPEPQDPTRKPFRRYLLTCLAVIVGIVVGRTVVATTIGGGSDLDAWGRAGMGLVAAVSTVSTGSFLLMVFAPRFARRIGLPSGAGGDERERHIFGHAYANGFVAGLVAVSVYGFWIDSVAVSALSALMMFTFLTTVVVLNRRV